MCHDEPNNPAKDRPLKMYRLNELDQMDRDIAAAHHLNDSDADDTSLTPTTTTAAPAMVLAFEQVPAIGTSVILNGQPYTFVAVELYIRKDGVASQWLTWEAPYWDCGEAFRVSLGLGGSKGVNRRCRKHRQPGSRVKGRYHASIRKPPMKLAA